MPSLVSCHVTWCIHHSVNHCTSVLCEMQCYYAHKIHGDSCASNLSVLICKTESAQSHSHSSGTGTYENLFCARGTLPACSFRSLFDLFDFETLCLSKACYSKDLEGHLMSFWLQSARALCFSLFLHLTWKEWHGMIFTAIPPVFLERILGATTTCFQRIATVQALPHSLRLFTQVSIENETLKLKTLRNEAYLHSIAQAFDFLKPS